MHFIVSISNPGNMPINHFLTQPPQRCRALRRHHDRLSRIGSIPRIGRVHRPSGSSGVSRHDTHIGEIRTVSRRPFVHGAIGVSRQNGRLIGTGGAGRRLRIGAVRAVSQKSLRRSNRPRAIFSKRLVLIVVGMM